MASRLYPTTRRLFRQVLHALKLFGLGACMSSLTFALMAVYITGLLLLDRRQNGTRIADWLPARAHDALNRLLRTHLVSTRKLAETQAKDANETEMLTAPAVRIARRDEAILALILYSGIRVGELVDLRLSDIEIGERSGRVKITGKGRKYREVPLHVNARHVLKDWPEVRPKDEETDHFFVGKGGPMTPRGVQQRLAKIGDAADVKVTLHILRHTFATRLLREAKVDIVTTSNLMGHENIATTTIYTQPTDADLEDAVAKL